MMLRSGFHVFTASVLLSATLSHAFLTPTLHAVRTVHASGHVTNRPRPSTVRVRMQEDDFLRSLIPGSWALEATVEGKPTEFFLTLNPDSTCTMPPGAGGGERDDRIRWKLKRTEFALEVPKRSSLSTSYMDRTFYGTLRPVREL